MSTDSQWVLLRAWLLCGDELQKSAIQNKTELRVWWDLNLGPLLFVYKVKTTELLSQP